MFDARLRPIIDPPLNRMGRVVARYGISANTLTAVGMLTGLTAATAIACGSFTLGLVLILTNRLIDGLDGAVARASAPSDLGGYLDIVGDFLFYVSVPVGFAIADPANALIATILIATFTITGISFLAYAVLAAKRGRETVAHGRKSFFYSTGLAEGAETIFVFVLMCLWPQWFSEIAAVYAILCVLTVIQRTLLARRDFRSTP